MRGCGNVPRYAAFMLLVLAFLLPVFDRAQAASYERKARYVNDYASLFTPQHSEEIATSLLEVEDRRGLEVAIITVKKLPQTQEEIDAFLERTYQDWKMGKTDAPTRSGEESLFVFSKSPSRADYTWRAPPYQIISKYFNRLKPFNYRRGRGILVVISQQDNAVYVKNGDGFGLAKGQWDDLNAYHFSPILAHEDLGSAIDQIMSIVIVNGVNMIESDDLSGFMYTGFYKPMSHFPLKRYDRYINDFARLLGPDVKLDVTEILKKYEHDTGTEVSILTVNSYESISLGESWEGFSKSIFEDFNIGGEEPNNSKNKGVLLVVSEGDRKVRIELGAGYSGIYDNVMQDVIGNIVPALHDEKYDVGIAKGVRQIISRTQANITFWEWYKWYFLAAGVVTLSLAAAIRNRFQNRVEIHWVILGVIGFVIIFIFLKLVAILSAIPSGNGNNYLGGFGGDFGGGDGGDSGGGASGSF